MIPLSDNAPPAEANDQVSEKDPMTDHRLKFHSTYTITVMKSRPVFLHALKLRQQTVTRPAVLRQIAYRPISSTSRLLNEQSSQKQDDQKSQKEQEKEKARQKRREEEEVNAPPQSPFKVFAQVLKEEISKNKAWQDNVKQLQGDVDKLADSQALKRAREVYERARVCLPLLTG